MHELSIAESIISTVIREKKERKLSSISTVGVRVGALSGVLPDALDFCWELAVAETSVSDAVLKIDRVPAKGVCRTCSQAFLIETVCFSCPGCGCDQVEIVSGWELDIAYLEVADDRRFEEDTK